MVREIIEKLACYSRRFESQTGPIYQTDLDRVFKEVAGFAPDDLALVVLQRLPGLGVKNQQDGARHFVDATLAQVAMAGEVIRYIQHPYEYAFVSDAREWYETIDEIGTQVLSHFIGKYEMQEGHVNSAINHAYHNGYNILTMDIILAHMFIEENWEVPKIVIKDITIKELRLDEFSFDYSNIEIQSCIIKN